jgi:eukaryotic-like serine/threonine-protein kinase
VRRGRPAYIGGVREGHKTETDLTVELCIAELGTMAETLAAHPRSTLAPPRTGEDDAMDALLRELARHDRLQIEELIGEGGMGAVHAATQRALRRKVAVKMLKQGLRTREATSRLLREALITGSLEHPNVLPVYDVHLDDEGLPRIVLKCIEGVTWADLIKDVGAMSARFGEQDLLDHNLGILMLVCRAVHFAHARGILHRDIKPENVMIGAFGEVYLHDWGIAVSIDSDDPSLRFVPEVAGTPAYMAPEMVHPRETPPSTRTDVYLLGSVLYEILAGRPPHDGRTPAEIVFSILCSEPELPADAPDELVGIVRRALARDSADRFESAEAFRLSIADYARHRSSARLTREAERTLAELDTSARSGGGGAQRPKLAALFGACRFGFEQALEGWPENAPAARGLERAIEIMIEHEIAHGDPDAAGAMLSELSRPKPELRDRVEHARRRHSEERERRHELERLGRLFDPSSEMRSRWIVASFLALAGTIIPVATQTLVDPTSNDYGPTFVLPACFLAGTLAIAIWKRHALARTIHNRLVVIIVIAGISGQIVVHAASAILGLPIVASVAMVAVMWAVLAALGAVLIDRAIAAVALGYLAAVFVIALFAETRRDANYVMSAAHLVTAITVFVSWRPRRSQPGQAN